MARPRLPSYWQHRIAELMLNEGLRNSPSKILKRLKVEFEEEPSEEIKYVPTLRTLEKYMGLIRQGKMALIGQRVWFQWPRDVGQGEDQVPWASARDALDCLGFYLLKHKKRPMIGLVKRFAAVALVTSGTRGVVRMKTRQRILIAEQLWYADLVEDLPGRERPSTTYEEFRLATKSWGDSSPDSTPPIGRSLDTVFLANRARKLGAESSVIISKWQRNSELKLFNYVCREQIHPTRSGV